MTDIPNNNEKVIVVDGFGTTLIEAENLGWIDPCYEPWTPENADATEQSAIEFMEFLGYTVKNTSDPDEDTELP